MPVFIKQPLSGVPSGMPLGVTATSQAGAQLIHQVQATATNVLELVTLWVNNASTQNAAVPVFEVTNGSNSATMAVQANQQDTLISPVLVLNQLPLSGTDSAIHGFATLGETFFAWGHVDRIATG